MKTETIKIKCTAEQKEIIQKEASKRSISASQYCLNAALDNEKNKSIVPYRFFGTIISLENKLDSIIFLLNKPKNQRDETWDDTVYGSFIELRKETKTLWGI